MRVLVKQVGLILMGLFMRIYMYFKAGWMFIGLFCLIISELICSLVWSQEPGFEGPVQTVSQVIIDIQDAPVTHTKYQDMAKNLMGIIPGEPFSIPRLQKAIQTLEKSNRFEHIFSDIIENDQGVSVYFRLTPFPLIKEIRIRGSFPLFESDILHMMTMAPGQIFKKNELREQEKGIIAFLNREGYPLPGVHISAERDPADGHMILQVDMNKGHDLTVNKVTFTGNQSISSFWLELKMNSDPTAWDIAFPKRWVEPELKKDIRILTDYYRKQGFVDCAIQYRTSISKNNRVSIFNEIEEGPFYDIRFKGNKSISASKLLKDMVLFNNGNRNDAGLKRTVSSIREQYQKNGFFQASINMTDRLLAEKSKKIREITFFVTEGPRFEISAVEITGNRAIETKAIQNQMLTEKSGVFRKRYFNPQELNEDINAIKLLYRRKGFIHVLITPTWKKSRDEKSAVVHLNITEKIQTIVSSVRFSGLTAISEKEAYQVIRLKRGTPFREYMIKTDQNALSSFISEKGYPFAVVTGRYELSKDQKKVSLIYHITQGNQVLMGQMYFTGNFKTKEKTLIAHMTQKPGEPFSLAKLLESQKNLRDMNIFNSVEFKPAGLEDKSENITLLVEVEERKPYYVEFGIGYETSKGSFMDSKIGDRNLLGKNQEAWLGVGYSEIGYRLESGLINPSLWGTDIAMNSTLFGEETKEFNQDFGTTVLGGNVGLSKNVFKNVTAGLSFRFERRDQFDNELTDVSPERINYKQFKPRTLFVVTPSFIHDTRDSFIQPKEGIFSNISMDISKGIDRSLDDFIRCQANLSYFTTPVNRLTFAWIGRMGYLEPLGSGNDVPQDQLFFLGGGADVRGFEENLLSYDALRNPLGGQTVLSTSVELRIDLGYHFELPLFFDTGKVSRIPSSEAEGKFRSSVGTGLRYITPIGPIGLLYGKNLDPEKGEPSARFHFSIGYTF